MIQTPNETGPEAAELQTPHTPHDHTNCLNFKQLEPAGQDLPEWMQPLAVVKPDLSEAQRLLSLGFKLVRLAPYTKQPAGEGWNDPENAVQAIDSTATGYGLHLASNGLVSIDPDNWSHAVKGMAALDLDLEEIMSQGVRTRSTRPGSGGRSTFKAPSVALEWLKFSSKNDGFGTMLELRATSPNLQDVIPGLVYTDKSGVLRGQSYANDKRLSDAPGLPQELLDWWHKCSTDAEFENEQRKLFCAAVGCGANLRLSWNGPNGQIELAYKSPQHRQTFNEANKVEDILQRHGYTKHRDDRWSCPTASGKPGIRQIPGKDGLWKSDHASDPLSGTFDAWVACVVLDHDGDLKAAQDAQDKATREKTATMFSPVSGAATPAGAGRDASGRLIIETSRDWNQRHMIPHELVQGLILSQSMVMFFGDSNAGKTFAVVDLACSVARGVDFMGHKVDKGPVVYVGAEGPNSVRSRVKSYETHHGAVVEGLSLLAFTPDLFADDLGTLEIIDAVQRVEATQGKVRMLVLDTLAASSGGAGENTSEMACVVRRIERLKNELDLCVVFIHHAGKNAAAGARGWSGIRAAVDTEIEVTDEASGVRVAKFTKQRDLPSKGRELRFKLKVIDIGVTNFGETASTCVIEPAGVGPSAVSNQSATAQGDSVVIDHVRQCCHAGQFQPASTLRRLTLAGVTNVRARVDKLLKDGLLIAVPVHRRLTGNGRAADCLFVFGDDPYRRMLDRTRTLRESISCPTEIEIRELQDLEQDLSAKVKDAGTVGAIGAVGLPITPFGP